MKPIADLHIHCSLKSFLGSWDESKRESIWNHISSPFPWQALAPIFDSQSNLNQAQTGGVKLFFAALHPLEQPIAKELYYIIKDIASNMPRLNLELMRKMKDFEKSSFEWMMEEWSHIQSHLNGPGGQSAKVLRTYTDYDPAFQGPQLVMNVEGGHSFYNQPGLGDAQDIHSIISNLESFKTNPDAPRIFYLTLSHLCQNMFANHAFGMKLINNPQFKPSGNGVTAEGKLFIDALLSTTNGYRILVDVKHMSAQSRKDYYQHNNGRAPILASHVGFTNLSWNEAMYLKSAMDSEGLFLNERGERHDGSKSVNMHNQYPWVRGHSQFVHHNPWTINLFKEEIPIIMNSGGLIGVSLDQRILGFGQHGEENISREEWLSLSSKGVKRFAEYNTQAKFQEYPDWRNEFFPTLHLKHFANNLVAMSMSGFAGDPWNHFAIGSDFDGLIDAINCCKDASQYQSFANRLADILHDIYKNDFNNPLPASTIDSIVDRVCFTNAERFLSENFTPEFGFD